MKHETFKYIFQKHRNRVYSYAFYFLRNREDAKDITQEVFIRVWEQQKSIHKKAMVPWIMKITQNCCIDHIRRKKSSRDHGGTTSVNGLDSIPSATNRYSNPELNYEFTKRQRAILNALKELPERTRGMLLLHYFQELKFREIGEIFNIKEGAVKVAVHRGRRMLKEILTAQSSEKAG